MALEEDQMESRHNLTLETTLAGPLWDIQPPWPFRLVYYGILVPLAYTGNFLTCVIVSRRLLYRNSLPDVLVGGLALNDFLTCLVVFTPSIVAEARGRWPSSLAFCQLHAVATVWYLYTTFAIIVLMSVERWLAIVRPFYHNKAITTLQMKLVAAGLGLFCLLLGAIPLFFYQVQLKPGWYCAVAHLYWQDGRLVSVVPDLYVAISMTFLLVGMVISVTCTTHLVVHLKRKQPLPGQDLTLERTFVNMMGIVGLVFLITWVPHLVSLNLCLFGVPAGVCAQTQYWSTRVVNMGVGANPLVYGVMKRNYRRGYIYLLRLPLHYLSGGLVAKPQGWSDIFGLSGRRSSHKAASPVAGNQRRERVALNPVALTPVPSSPLPDLSQGSPSASVSATSSGHQACVASHVVNLPLTLSTGTLPEVDV